MRFGLNTLYPRLRMRRTQLPREQTSIHVQSIEKLLLKATTVFTAENKLCAHQLKQKRIFAECCDQRIQTKSRENVTEISSCQMPDFRK